MLHASKASAAPPDSTEPPHDADPPVALALITGAATAILPAALGAIHTAGVTSDADGPRNVGFAVAGAGFALAPIAAHVVLGEWTRAAAFGAVPVAAEIGGCALLAARPDALFHGTVLSRTTFAVLFSADIFGSALGMVDVVMAGERARARRKRAVAWPHGLTIAPRVGAGHAGLVLGGAL